MCHAPTELTNCMLYYTLTIAATVHYCTLDVLMNTQTTFKSPVGLNWAVTGSAGWCVRSRFASQVRMSMVRCTRLQIWNLVFVYSVRAWAEINYDPLVAHSALIADTQTYRRYTLHCSSTSWLAPLQLQPIWSSEENCIHRHTLRKLYNDATSSDKWAHEIITRVWWLLVEVKWSLCRLLDIMHYSLLTTNNPRHL